MEPFVMIKNYDIIYEDLDYVVGLPVPYKVFEEKVTIIYIVRALKILKDQMKFSQVLIILTLMN